MPLHVLVADDHPDALDSLAGFVEQLGHRVSRAADGRQALELVRSGRPDLVVSDLRMPGLSGLQLLAALEEFDDPPPLALITAFADAATAVEAMRLGAIDYLRKPLDVRELHRLLERLECVSSACLPAIAGESRPGPDGLVVASAATARVVELADRLHRAADLPCLIEAETGCGKELIARRIHHGGREAGQRPFVAVNCAAIAPGLFEAELFGYATGAFTGAAPGGAPGKLLQAGAGTVFLDEVGELPLDQQAKLLRVLEERTFYPVGGTRLQRLEARVVCATNRNLFQRASAGAFREDLLYRLKVGFIRVPPLRERRDEILPLARAFLAAIRNARGTGFAGLAAEAGGLLEAAPWPGNVRQLRHVLERASVLHGDGGLLTRAVAEDVLAGEGGASAAPALPGGGGLALAARPPAAIEMPEGGFALDEWYRALIAGALRRCDGSPVRTAAYLGITRKVLYTLRRRYGLMEDG